MSSSSSSSSLPFPTTDWLDTSLELIYSFQPLIEKYTVILVPNLLKEQVLSLSNSIGMDIETVQYVLGLFLCYPLGLIMLNIPFDYIRTRHLCSFLFGLFLLQFTLGVQWIHHLITCLISYGMILVLPPRILKYVLPIFAVTYLTCGHLHRMYINYLGWDLDFTGTHMVLTQKLYMIAYNLYDGQMLKNVRQNAPLASKKCAPYALRRIPTILEFLGYTFCFSTILVGPALEYTLYLRIIDGSIMKGPDRQYVTSKNRPSNILPTIIPLATSLLNMGLFLFLSSKFPILDPNNPQQNLPSVLQPQFQSYALIKKIAYLLIGYIGLRQKYYFGWKNAEGALNIWYGGFDGYKTDIDGNVEAKGFTTSVNAEILNCELASNLQIATKSWNIKTSNWLTRYVYIRTNGSLIATYTMSAFWHGFYPGYYICFLTLPIFTMCDRLAKKKISPYFVVSSPTFRISYNLICILITSCALNYAVIGFTVLALEWSLELYKSLYFIGHVVGIVFYGILVFVLPTPTTKTKEE